MSKHTPGPWIIELQNQDAPLIREDQLGLHIAQLASISDDGHEELANACLIAAAPDLLAALELAKLTLGARDGPTARERDAAIKNANIAIAKAKGEV